MHTPRAQVTAAIVTCGGLCPGLNDVVQNIVYTLADYGVPLDQVRLSACVSNVYVHICACVPAATSARFGGS